MKTPSNSCSLSGVNKPEHKCKLHCVPSPNDVIKRFKLRSRMNSNENTIGTWEQKRLLWTKVNSCSVCSHILLGIMLDLHLSPLKVPPATILRGEFVRVASICKNDVIWKNLDKFDPADATLKRIFPALGRRAAAPELRIKVHCCFLRMQIQA